MSSDRDLVCQLPSTVFVNFRTGVNFYNDGTTRLIVFKAVDKLGAVTWSACFNKCRHNGGTFVADIEDSAVVTCAYHGWQLDCSTMEYVNPPDCVKQDPLIVEFDDDSNVMNIFIQVQSKPWLINRRQKQVIKPGEFGVTYFSHACVEIRAGSKTIVTDPWLTGPAFARGWWLLHEPPADAFERVAKADAIYISHSHPDHCNVPTLKRILAINPDIQIFVADLHKPIFKGDAAALGIKNVNLVSMGSWIDFDADTRMMILPDKLYPHLDTELLVEHKGHRILNLVDCCNPNDGNLPDDVSLLLTDFASGASGFPSCFSDMYGEEKVLQVAQEKATTFLKKIAKHVALTQAKAWLPFAGYFVEAHPSDDIVKRLNWKNTPQRAEKMLLARFPHLISWIFRYCQHEWHHSRSNLKFFRQLLGFRSVCRGN
jgi:CMP-N-acetylneuraminate monooxygenase